VAPVLMYERCFGMAVWRSRCAPDTRSDVSGARKVCERAAGKWCVVWCDELVLHAEFITRCVLGETV
jgi:hypothetical protein